MDKITNREKGLIHNMNNNIIKYQFKWKNEIDSSLNSIDATEGGLKLYVYDELVWGADKSIYWDWIELLEFLCANWIYLCLEEDHRTFKMALDEIRSNLYGYDSLKEDAPRNINLRQKAYEFTDRHDLARSAMGISIKPLMVMRTGNSAIIAIGNKTITAPFNQIRKDLAQIGDIICDRISSLNDERAAYCVNKWHNKEKQANPKLKLKLTTGLSESDITKVQQSDSAESFWELEKDDFEGISEIQAAARSLSGVELGAVRDILNRIKNQSRSPTKQLDLLSQKAIKVLNEHESKQLYEQGYILARWLRKHLNVEPHHKFNPEEVLNTWHVTVETIMLSKAPSLQAISCWGPKHGPVVYLNEKGKYNKNLSGKRATLAHEICHLILDRFTSLPLVEVFGGNTPMRAEQRANAFAAELLIPCSEIEAYFKKEIDLERAVMSLSSKFSVGHIIIANQILNSKELSLSEADTFTLENIRQRYE